MTKAVKVEVVDSSPSDPTSDEREYWTALQIIDERKDGYKVSWEGNDEHGNPWAPTWTAKRDCTPALIKEWKAKKKAKQDSKKTKTSRASSSKSKASPSVASSSTTTGKGRQTHASSAAGGGSVTPAPSEVASGSRPEKVGPPTGKRKRESIISAESASSQPPPSVSTKKRKLETAPSDENLGASTEPISVPSRAVRRPSTSQSQSQKSASAAPPKWGTVRDWSEEIPSQQPDPPAVEKGKGKTSEPNVVMRRSSRHNDDEPVTEDDLVLMKHVSSLEGERGGDTTEEEETVSPAKKRSASSRSRGRPSPAEALGKTPSSLKNKRKFPVDGELSEDGLARDPVTGQPTLPPRKSSLKTQASLPKSAVSIGSKHTSNVVDSPGDELARASVDSPPARKSKSVKTQGSLAKSSSGSKRTTKTTRKPALKALQLRTPTPDHDSIRDQDLGELQDLFGKPNEAPNGHQEDSQPSNEAIAPESPRQLSALQRRSRSVSVVPETDQEDSQQPLVPPPPPGAFSPPHARKPSPPASLAPSEHPEAGPSRPLAPSSALVKRALRPVPVMAADTFMKVIQSNGEVDDEDEIEEFSPIKPTNHSKPSSSIETIDRTQENDDGHHVRRGEGLAVAAVEQKKELERVDGLDPGARRMLSGILTVRAAESSVQVPQSFDEDDDDMMGRYIDLNGGQDYYDQAVPQRQEEEENTQDLEQEHNMQVDQPDTPPLEERSQSQVAPQREEEEEESPPADEDLQTDVHRQISESPTSTINNARVRDLEARLEEATSTLARERALWAEERATAAMDLDHARSALSDERTASTESLHRTNVEADDLRQLLALEQTKSADHILAVEHELEQTRGTLVEVRARAERLEIQLRDGAPNSPDSDDLAARAEALEQQLAESVVEYSKIESDREKLVSDYQRANDMMMSVRRENIDLEARTKIAEDQVKTGVEMIKATFAAQVSQLQDEILRLQQLQKILTAKDQRTGDEIRTRAAQWPDLQTKIAEQRNQLVYLHRDVIATSRQLFEAVLHLVRRVDDDSVVCVCADSGFACGEVFSAENENVHHDFYEHLRERHGLACDLSLLYNLIDRDHVFCNWGPKFNKCEQRFDYYHQFWEHMKTAHDVDVTTDHSSLQLPTRLGPLEA